MKLNLFVNLITCSRIFSEKLAFGLSAAIKSEQSGVINLLGIAETTDAEG